MKMAQIGEADRYLHVYAILNIGLTSRISRKGRGESSAELEKGVGGWGGLIWSAESGRHSTLGSVSVLFSTSFSSSMIACHLNEKS